MTCEYESDLNNENLNSFKDNELFDDDSDVVHKIIRVKLIKFNNQENWEISDNNKIMFIVSGEKLTKKEKTFLKTANGMNILIALYKANSYSFYRIKKEIKEYLK